MDDLEVVAHAASMLVDPLRLRILVELENGVLTVSELMARLAAPQPRISAHLAILRDAGWVEVIAQGRQRYYRLVSPQINVAILELAAMPIPPTENPVVEPIEDPGSIEPELRSARTCYDHIAGIAGVQLCDHFLQNDWLVPVEEGVGKYQPAYALTETGERALARRGVSIPQPRQGRRRFAYACPDWTEGRPHLGGALATAIYERLQQAGVLKRTQGTRILAVDGDVVDWFTNQD